MEQFTKPVEGQFDGQETPATHGDLTISGSRRKPLKAVRQLAG
jgi:hypothetical protein